MRPGRRGQHSPVSETNSLAHGGVDVVILRIEHPVPDYAGWKHAFDGDPANRKQSGVRRYQILRSLDDSNYVMIDLEFDTKSEAEALLAKMRVIWERIQGTTMSNPQARIVETVERVEL
jgi:hypothetical protein